MILIVPPCEKELRFGDSENSPADFTLVRLMRPPKPGVSPASLRSMSPPTNAKLWGLLSLELLWTDKEVPLTAIFPGLDPRKPNRTGSAIVKELCPGLTASNLPPSASFKYAAVVAVKDPLTFNSAPGPKMMPAGLMRKKLASGRGASGSARSKLTCSSPSIADTSPPVTRARIFFTLAGPEKIATSPAGMPNWLKL